MKLQQLRSYVDGLAAGLPEEDQLLLKARLEGLTSAFPFSEHEFILTFLVAQGVLTFSQYEEVRTQYISGNKYLDLFGLAPRIFGQVWGEQHLQDIQPRIVKASRLLDAQYAGEYDLWLEGVRIEVKAARAIDTKRRGDMRAKALHYGSVAPFWMNFQQLKLDVCDVFVFIGVWVDEIHYWVLSNAEVKVNKFLSHQHRGGIEFQIGITDKNISEFDQYLAPSQTLVEKILAKKC